MNPEVTRGRGDVPVAVPAPHVDVLPARAGEREDPPLRRGQLPRWLLRLVAAERGDELLRRHRLGELVVRPELDRRDAGGDRRVGRAKDDAHLRVFVPKWADKGQTVAAGD